MTKTNMEIKAKSLLGSAIENGSGVIEAKCFFLETPQSEADIELEAVEHLSNYGEIRLLPSGGAEITYIGLLRYDPPALSYAEIEKCYFELLKSGLGEEGLIEASFSDTSESDFIKIEAERAAMEFALQLKLVRKMAFGIFSLTSKGRQEIESGFPTAFAIVQPSLFV